jgi:hypothetical protein
MGREFVFIGFIMVLMTSIMLNINSVFGHNFKSDESAEFLTFIDKLKAELQLVLANIQNNDIDLAKKHSIIANDLYWLSFQEEIAEKNKRIATNLKNSLSALQNSSFKTNSDIDKINTTIKDIEDIIAESISIRINPEHINNSTIQMLRLTNLLNAIDIYYTKGVNTSTSNLRNANYFYNNSEIINYKNLSQQNYTLAAIEDPAYYQSASELAQYTEKLFDTKLKKYLLNDETKIDHIHDNLENLKNSIKSKLNYEKIAHIISSTQSMLNQNFNLSLT